ncbi:2-methylisocitrate lyase-like PEP mutase family enzyme [Pseudarthrobacter sp. SLBN-100]|nr:hypothetical protein [Arthrobacter sp. SLBN-100]
MEAGADAIFTRAMKELSEFQAIGDAVDVPILANMTEFGQSAPFTVEELAGPESTYTCECRKCSPEPAPMTS